MQFMWHQPIEFDQVSISYEVKQCIHQFSATIYAGEKIAIIGRNGSGKTSLIKALTQSVIPSAGSLVVPDDVVIGFVPQVIEDVAFELSGGQRFNQKLSQALSVEPNLLLLDEPTNHLDQSNRRALMSMLKRYSGTMIVASHDAELLNTIVDTIWHVSNGNVTIFDGKYSDYVEQQKTEWLKLNNQVKQLNLDKKKTHQQLMQEQQRAKNSRSQGEKHIKERKWPTITSGAKARRAETTSGKNSKRIEQDKQAVVSELESLYIPEVIVPRFNLDALLANKSKMVLTISNGSCGYAKNILLNNIYLNIAGSEKVVLTGDNASGKSTLLKAILGDLSVNKFGDWLLPSPLQIGYLDQHYASLDSNKTAVELMHLVMLNANYAEIRNHLNSFLLRKNEEVHLESGRLSGGEKVRLNLALIAASPPRLLLLDEITNNVDLETKEHLVQVLNSYPGAFILTCHEQGFIDKLTLDSYYYVEQGTLCRL